MRLKAFPILLALLLFPAPAAAQPDLVIADQILFVTDRDGNSEIYVMNPDGTGQTRLTNNAATDKHPAWGPTGKQILFSTDRDGNFEVYVGDRDGTNLINLTSNAAVDSAPAWAPNGSKILFQTDRDGNFEIYSMDPDGSNPTNLTSNAASDMNPTWSADGSKIYFQTMRDGNWEIYSMDPDGSNPTNLSSNAAADERPNGSPDGTEIVFDTDRDGNVEIYRMNSDGTGQTNLTSNAANDIEASWSADGTHVAFRTNRDGNDEIYSMDRDGGDPLRLITDANVDEQAAWFELKAIGKTTVGFEIVRQIKVSNIGGSTLNIATITSSDPQFTLDPTSLGISAASDQPLTIIYDPTSGGVHPTTLTFTSDDPDEPTITMVVHGIGVDEPVVHLAGNILFSTDRDGNDEIYVMDLDGTGQTRLTNDPGADIFPSFSPDGGHVTWMTDRDGNFEVYSMEGDGSNPVNLTNDPATDGEPSWSPDGLMVTFMTDRDGNFEIYSMFGDGSNPVNLTNDAGNDKHPRWSPDGSKIIFQSDRDGNEEIYSMNPDGTGQTRLTTDGGTDELAQFSPDGTKIAFSSDRDGDFEIFLMDADGSNQMPVTDNASLDTKPVWSPDGTRLTFASDRNGTFDLFSRDVGGGRLVRLTDDPGNDVDPDFSQLRLVAITEVDTAETRTVFIENRGNVTLNVSNITSSDPQFVLSTTSFGISPFSDASFDVTFTPTSPGFFNSTLTITSDDPVNPTVTLTINGEGFTPDPDLLIVSDLVYVSDRDGNDEIYGQDLEMPSEFRLTNDAGTDTDPHVSPDGTQIAFSTNRDGNFEIYVMDADGSNPTRLTNDAGIDAFAAWSPTGKQIAFQTNRDGNDEIYVMDADGSNPTRLTNNANGDFHPRWSPDGLKIAFHSDRDGNDEIYVMDVDGSNQTRLTNDAATDREPDWSPNGLQIAFTSGRDGNDEIYKMDADGSNLVRMTNDPGVDESPTWAPSGSKIAFRSNRDGDGEIFIVNSDGSMEFPFVQNSNEERVPSWGNYRLVADTPAGVPASADFRVFNPGQGDLVVSSITSSDPQFTFSPSSFVVEEGQGQTVTVTFAPVASTTSFATFTVNSNDTDAPVITLTANGTGLPNGGTPTIDVDLSTRDFDSTRVDTTVTLPIAVRNIGAGLLNVSSVVVAGNGFTGSTSGPETVVVGDSLVIDVDFSPLAVGLLVGEVQIHHDAPNTGSPVVVPVRGIGVDAIPLPSLAVIDFGDVERNAFRTIQVTVTNVGNLPLTITDVEPDSGIFGAGPDSVDVGIGESFGVVDVTFAPDSTLSFTDTLRIHHNGSASPILIPLSGNGVPEPPPPVPILAFGLVNIDTGPIQLGGAAQFPLAISNTGNDTLRVTAISSDVPGVSFSTTAFDVPPGADSTVTVDVAPATAGPFEGSVTVTHNAAGSPSSIPIAGDAVVPEVGFVDAAADFGPVQTGTMPTVTVMVTNNSPNPLDVTGVAVDGPFTADDDPFTLGPGEERGIVVSFDAGPPGLVEGLLRLLHQDPFVGPLEIPIRADVLGEAFSTGPDELFMVDPGPGLTARDTLAFTNKTDSTLTVNAETTDPRLTVDPVSASVGPGEIQDFVVTFTSDGAGETSAELILSHNAPGSPAVVVPVLVQGGEAEIAFGIDNFQFDLVGIGDTATAILAVRNPGSDTLFVNGIEGDPGLTGIFSVDPPTFSIAPGDSLEVTVRFVPMGPGSFADFLAFDANVGLGDVNAPRPGVSVIGVGSGPEAAVAPDRLFFATQDAGVTDTQTVVLTNVGNDTLEVFAVETATPWFAASDSAFSLGEGESRNLEVVYTPDSTVARVDTLLILTNAQDTVAVPLEAPEIAKNIGNAELTLSRLDTLMAPQVGDTISLSLELATGGDTVLGADVFVGIPAAFFAPVDEGNPFTRAGATSSALVLVNDTVADTTRNRLVASLSTSLFTPQSTDGTLARIDLVVIAPLEGPAPVGVLSEFPERNSQYLVSDPAGQTFSFRATEPLAFGNLPPRILSLPLLKTEEDGSAELLMNSRVIDPDGPFSELTFAFEPRDSLFGVTTQVLLDTIVTAVFFPPPDRHGVFSVRIIATDAGAASDTSDVLIEVSPVNDAPVVEPDTILVRGGGFVRIPLLTRATDIDGDSLTVTSVTAATNGTVELHEDRTATYTPEEDFRGEASFSFVVDDGNGGTATGTMVMDVTGTNANPQIAALPEMAGVVDSPFAFVLAEFKVDADDPPEALAWAVDILSGPADTARVDGDLLEVFPTPGGTGVVRLLLALFDPFGGRTARTVEILIRPTGRVGDFNGDDFVDFFDLIIFTAAWALSEGDPGFVPLADLDFDGEIGFPDFQIFARHFGN